MKLISIKKHSSFNTANTFHIELIKFISISSAIDTAAEQITLCYLFCLERNKNCSSPNISNLQQQLIIFAVKMFMAKKICAEVPNRKAQNILLAQTCTSMNWEHY